jgi:hypothetical protein
MLLRQHKLGLVKLYVCLATFVGGYHVLSDSHFHDGSLWLLTALAVIFFLGMTDAVINDLLPEQFVAPAVFHTKYLSFIALSGVNISLMYPGLVASEFNTESVLYAFNAVVAVGVAIADFAARYRENHETHATNSLPSSTSPG